MLSDNQNILPSNSYEDAMDVESEECCSSTTGSDHRFSTASISLCSDEISEFSDEEMSDESSALADKQRDFEGESSDDEDDQNPWDVHSDSSESVDDGMDIANSSDDEEAALEVEVVREVLEEARLEKNLIDVDVPYQYSVEEQSWFDYSDSDDESENASEHEEEQEKAPLEGEVLDDEIEVGSEHSEHLEIVEIEEDQEKVTLEEVFLDDEIEVGSEHSELLEIVTPQYSTVGPSWFVFSDSESEISDDNETKDVIDIEDASIDSNEDKSEHNEEEMSVELDTPMSDLNAIPSSELSAEEKEELKRNHEFLESAPLASNSSESSLTSSEEAEFRVFIQLTREREALVNGQEIAVEVQDMLEEQVVAVDHAPGIGHGVTLLEVVIANGGIQPQLRSSEITHNWLYDFTNHF